MFLTTFPATIAEQVRFLQEQDAKGLTINASTDTVFMANLKITIRGALHVTHGMVLQHVCNTSIRWLSKTCGSGHEPSDSNAYSFPQLVFYSEFDATFQKAAF